MSQQIAEFYAKITADTTSLQASLDAANKKLDGMANKSQSTGSAVGGLQGKIMSMINPTTLAMSAVTGLALYLGNATKAAAESAQVDAKLAAVLKATGYAAGLTATDIDGMSMSLSKMSGVDDEVIKSSAAVLATFREVGGEVFPEAMQAALDMSAVMGGDLQGAIVQIGKALNDPIAGVSALRKVGVALTDQQKEQIATFMASGDIMSAQAVILKELQMEFGGAAEEMNEAGDGSAGLGVALGNLAEAIGGKLLPSWREMNKAATSGIDALTAAITAEESFRQSLMNVNPELYNQYVQQHKVTEEMRLAVAQYEKSKTEIDGWEAGLKAANQAQLEAAASMEALKMTQEQFNAEMETLGTILDGELGTAQENFNAKMEEYTRLLGEAQTQEEKDKINANIAAETAEYNKRAYAIAFNIQQEALMNSQLPPESKLAMITSLGQAYGMYDEATATAINSTNEWIARVEAGTLTEEAALQYMTDMARSMRETGVAADEVVAPLEDVNAQIYHTGERAKDAEDGFGALGSSASEMGDVIRSDATPAVGGLKSQIQGLPADGSSWHYNFEISVSGQVPKLPGVNGVDTSSGHTLCFVRGTLVTLSDGTHKPIEQIKEGDKVRSYNTQTGRFTAGVVSKIFSRPVDQYLSINGLKVTGEHPLWIVNRAQFVPAKSVQVGDVLLTDYAAEKVITLIFKVMLDVEVFNMTVEGDHTYFAGGILVHNKSTEDIEAGFSGGQLGDKWAIVGDMPGGGWGPYTEVITPWGEVLDAKRSKKLKDSGVLDGAVPMMFGGELGPGVFTPGGGSTIAPKPKPRTGRVSSSSGSSGSGSNVSVGGSSDEEGEEVVEAVSGISTQVTESVKNSILASIIPAQRAALSASTMNITQLKELNNNLRELIGKTASSTDISRAVQQENSKYS